MYYVRHAEGGHNAKRRYMEKGIPKSEWPAYVGNPNVLSDVLVARILLLAGLQASRENVEVNLRSLPPEDDCVAALRTGMNSITPHHG